MSLRRLHSVAVRIVPYAKHNPGYCRKWSTDLSPSTQALADSLLRPTDDYQRRMALAKAITLAEGSNPSQMHQADLLLQYLGFHLHSQHDYFLDNDNKRDERLSFRIGITGSPGVGKSTFIDALGKFILDSTNLSLAVLCIDPSSTISGGSILGDKARMPFLSNDARVFVRPSPSKGSLGGISTYTHDAVTLCEAAGYDLILVESVGVGQSEIEISHCVDMAILLIPPGGGDSLQGMKKGIVEIVDLMVVTKADGELLDLAISTASEYTGALHLARTRVYHEGISPSVIVASSKSLHGISQAWESISQFRKTVSTSGEIHRKRKENLKYWMWRHLRDLIESSTRSNKDLQRQSKMIENDLYSGILPPRAAARSLYGQILTHGEGKLFKT